MKRPLWWRRMKTAVLPRRRVHIVAGDSLPNKLPRHSLLLARDEDEDWCVGMRCPCGCGQTIELMLLREVKPRWDLVVDAGGYPTLHPSVWLQRGCHSHFWLKNGRVYWCD